MKEQDIPVIGMINYEMIGYFTDEANSQNYPIEGMKVVYPTIGNFIAMVSNESSKVFLNELNFTNDSKKISSINIVLPQSIEQLSASDHLNYWQFGFNAIMVTDTAYFRNPNYHKKSDTLDTLNIEKLKYVVEIVVDSINNFARFRAI